MKVEMKRDNKDVGERGKREDKATDALTIMSLWIYNFLVAQKRRVCLWVVDIAKPTAFI